MMDEQIAPSLRLGGRVAVVTGAGRGIGRSCALALAEAGAEVVAVSRTAADLELLCDEIRGRGGKASHVVCDVAEAGQIRDGIGRLARIDVLVNNAGTNIPEPFVNVTEAHLDRLLTLNLKGNFLVAQEAVKRMLAGGRGGSIVHVSSQMGHVGAPNRSVYCMTKHGIEGLTKAMAVELAPHGIRVNAVAPTFIETPMTRPFFAQPAFLEDTLRRIPLGRVGQPPDVAAAVLFLSSPAASLITGASLLIDGGWTAQ